MKYEIMYILQMISVDFLIYCYMGFCIFHIRKSYDFGGIEYVILISHIDIWEQIFTHHIWNFSCFVCGNLSPDILENIWNSLYFPSKNKMRNFWDEIWIFAHFSYENQGTDFLTWQMNCVYFRHENRSSDFLHEIWNFLF